MQKPPNYPDRAKELKDITQKRIVHGKGVLYLTDSKVVAEDPLRVGVVFSGGPAAGGHNVVIGLWQALLEIHRESALLGFLGGPSGLVDGEYINCTHENLLPYLNTGGFDLLGSGRTKLETEEQFEKIAKVVQELNLQGIVFIGGDDTATNAFILSQYLQKKGLQVSVVSCPKTIDGDLRSEDLELSFGFDTATRVYSEMIGNLCIDGRSSRKYWHFVKLMGRSASHVTLECALQTQPNIAFIGEEVSKEGNSLDDLVKVLSSTMLKRHQAGLKYGIVLIPEGLLEFIPEMKGLIDELNTLLAQSKGINELSEKCKKLYDSLPQDIQTQLTAKRDAHGNVALSQIETEKLLILLVTKELQNSGVKEGDLACVPHFYGYEGRCSVPSLFDRTYCYNLGFVAALLVRDGQTGTMAAIKGLKSPCDTWQPIGIPLDGMMHTEERNGVEKEVIKKALVDLSSPAFTAFKEHRKEWSVKDNYISPGPMQLYGDRNYLVPKTLSLDCARV